MNNKRGLVLFLIVLIALLAYISYLIYQKRAETGNLSDLKIEEPILGKIDEGAAVDDKSLADAAKTKQKKTKASVPSAESPEVLGVASDKKVEFFDLAISMPATFEVASDSNALEVFDKGRLMGQIQVLPNLFNKETLLTQQKTLDLATGGTSSIEVAGGLEVLYYNTNDQRLAIFVSKDYIYYISGVLIDYLDNKLLALR